MKYLLVAMAVLSVAGCQKDITIHEDSSEALILSSDAVLPLACHATTYSTSYTSSAGKIPPFRFTKTLYSDTRVNTINMLSRANPVHSQYKPQAYELTGKFTYSANQALFTGSQQLWEYYKTSSGAAAKKSISRRNISYRFVLNARGYVTSVYNITDNHYALNIEYDPSRPNVVTFLVVNENVFYYPQLDQYGNTLSYDLPYNRWSSRVSYTYDYTQPRGTRNLLFAPTQNFISQEYSLLEVMQWLPQPSHFRKTIAAEFYPYPKSTAPFNTGYKVVQSQTYKNYKFDSKGNLSSFTYADNILQKISWHCK